MGCEQMLQRMSFVLKGEFLNKVSVRMNEDGVMVIRVDLHGMSKHVAAKAIRGILLLNNGHFVLDLIHGYNHGTVLKNLIQFELEHERIGRRWGYAYNPGETFLEVKAAF